MSQGSENAMQLLNGRPSSSPKAATISPKKKRKKKEQEDNSSGFPGLTSQNKFNVGD
jgi:hypothetical protein